MGCTDLPGFLGGIPSRALGPERLEVLLGFSELGPMLSHGSSGPLVILLGRCGPGRA
jgi:hypothetical protein